MKARLVSAFNNKEMDLSQQIASAFEAAIKEALVYVGRTAPNPPVGCAVLDQEGNILTVAAHHQAGTLHAEALALQQCRDLGVWDRISDIIVTLEPCNHTGRTAPCSEALLSTPAQRIWVGVQDPNPHVHGAGNQRLSLGGKEVILLQDIPFPVAQYWLKECQNLVAPFISSVTKRKAWITVKQALNPEGSMIPPVGYKTFTSHASLRLAHQLRRGTEAIITGVNTIKADWPSFTVRHVPDHPYKQRLLVVCSRQEREIQEVIPLQYLIEAQNNGFSVILCHDLTTLPTLLTSHDVMWGMVEGGPQLLQAIRQNHLWDEWLTIRKRSKAEDEVRLMTRHAVSPTHQLLFYADACSAELRQTKDILCSLVS